MKQAGGKNAPKESRRTRSLSAIPKACRTVKTADPLETRTRKTLNWETRRTDTAKTHLDQFLLARWCCQCCIRSRWFGHVPWEPGNNSTKPDHWASPYQRMHHPTQVLLETFPSVLFTLSDLFFLREKLWRILHVFSLPALSSPRNCRSVGTEIPDSKSRKRKEEKHGANPHRGIEKGLSLSIRICIQQANADRISETAKS